MKIVRKYLTISAILVIFHGSSFAVDDYLGFESVNVELQSGEIVSLKTLPFFEILFKIEAAASRWNRWKRFASEYAWAFYAPPKFCPFDFYWYVHNNVELLNGYMSSEKCNIKQAEKLNHLPEDLRSICACRLILKTEAIAKNKYDVAIWKSYDDRHLYIDSLPVRKRLVDGDQEIHVIIQTTGANMGIYDFKGNKLCGAIENVNVSPVELIEKSISGDIYTEMNGVKFKCFEKWIATLNTASVKFNHLTKKASGDMLLNFDDGNKYLLKDY